MLIAKGRQRLVAMAAATIGVGYCTIRQRSMCSAKEVVSKPLLLITDVDETLIGDAASLKRFNKEWCKFAESEKGKGSYLAYNTARPLGPGHTGDGFIELVASEKFPIMRPDLIIVSEGTEIYWLSEDKEFVADEEWKSKMSANWDDDLVQKALKKYDEKIWKPERDMNADDHYRYAITVSCEEEARRIRDEAQAMLGPKYVVESCHGWLENMWLVTALPADAGKDKAAEHVRRTLGFENSDRVMWAGDSDNDVPMLNLTGTMSGVVVGNAKSKKLRSAADSDAPVSSVYQASEDHAAGILEGLRHFKYI